MNLAPDPFMAGVRPSGLQRGRGGFLRSADDAPYVTDPSGDTVASGARKGEVKRLKYGSPSNRGREIENDAGLVKYRQRLSFAGIGMDPALADACRDLAVMPVGSPEFNAAADAIAVAADRLTRSSLAADRGTHGHTITETVDRGNYDQLVGLYAAGEPFGLSVGVCAEVATAWAKMLIDNGLEVLAIEASCVDDTWRLAGTLDRIVRTTRDLTFVKSGGELVVIPANTVLILDIKFGKCRKAHPIQIASYAQSVPYDTETEVRGEWPWAIDQTHALIAHGDFGDDTRPVSIELVWVDLVAGRTHGGETVVQAKAWAARDDVFSVAQLDVPVEDTTQAAANAPWMTSTGTPVAPRAESADRLALVDARAALATTPDQGADLSGAEHGEQWATLQRHYEDLNPAAHSWLAGLIGEATRRGVDFHARRQKTLRGFELYRALISLCAAGGDQDELLRALLALVVGDVALFPAIHPGHVVGSLGAAEATRFADLVDVFNGPGLAAYIDNEGLFRLRGEAA